MIWFFLSFGYYGLTLWVPQYFSDRSSSGDSQSSGGADPNDETNNDKVDNNDMYLTSVISALSALPANVISIFTVRSYGRIKTLSKTNSFFLQKCLISPFFMISFVVLVAYHVSLTCLRFVLYFSADWVHVLSLLS